ncbi:hypothetical protein SY88_22415 [Clostridiales bacterium PH28_bin88]|nr:hypothetical protein SY88_22415 [Clostridiales bacterium PH28_bin88]
MISGLTSIIVLAHNALPYTRECIESIRSHTPEPHELILVDNGSTDGTAAYLEKVPGARLIKNTANAGYARGNNQGIAASRGEYVLFLNNDTVVTAGWLGKLLKCFKSDPRIGAVGPKTNRLGNMRQVVKNPPYRDMAEMHLFAGRCGPSNPARWETLPWLSGFCLLTSRRILQQVGNFDERFGLGLCEDNDFCLRLRKAGYRLVCAGDTFIHHYQSATFRENGIDRAKMLQANLARLRAKWPKGI